MKLYMRHEVFREVTRLVRLLNRADTITACRPTVGRRPPLFKSPSRRGPRSGRSMPDSHLFGISESRYPGDDRIDAEVASMETLGLAGGDLLPPAVLSRKGNGPANGRPVSPGTVEKSASLLRSLSFVANRPLAGETSADRSAAFEAVGDALRRELRSDPMGRLFDAAPLLGQRLQSSLLATCGAMLGAQHADGGFAWALAELDELAKHVPPASSTVFPGAYYFEIFSADVTELSRALEASRREHAKRTSIAACRLTPDGTHLVVSSRIVGAAGRNRRCDDDGGGGRTLVQRDVEARDAE